MLNESDAGHCRAVDNMCVNVTDRRAHTRGNVKQEPHDSRPIKPLIREPVTDGTALYATQDIALEYFP